MILTDERRNAPPLVVLAGPTRTVISPSERLRLSDAPAEARHWLLQRRTFSSREVRGRLAWRRADAALLAEAASGRTSSITLRPHVAALTLRLPVVRQAFRNNCETAALSMALRGVVGQRRLQDQLPAARPIDERRTPSGMVWGNPQRGFVGRADGRGFGVFERPLARLALRYDSGTEIIRSRTFAGVLAYVRAGRPVVAWTGLGTPAPWTWLTPAGTRVHANRAQHTVVLAGVNKRGVIVNDPWTGRQSIVPAERLAAGWMTLGRRAVATSAGISRLT